MPGLKLIHVSKRGPRYCFALKNTSMINKVRYVIPAYTTYHKRSSCMIMFGYQTSFNLLLILFFPLLQNVASWSVFYQQFNWRKCHALVIVFYRFHRRDAHPYPFSFVIQQNCHLSLSIVEWAYTILFVEAATYACLGFTTGYKEYKVYFLHKCNFWESTSGNTIGQTYV